MTKVTKSNIKTIAEKVKSNVEKNEKLPSTVTVDNVKYTWAQVWYILSWAVNNPNKDLTQLPTVTKCSSPQGDSINEDIKPEDYKKQASNVVKWIKDHKGVCPNWVTSIKSKKRIRPRLSIYANAKIIVWYYTHKQLPNYCNYNSHVFSSTTNANSSKKSKYGHATKSGCDNRGQNTSVNCGPHSVQEIVRNLTGVIIPQSTLASWAGTTSGGSSHAGLETAIAMAAKKTEVKLSCKWYNFSDLGWNGINKIIKSSNQDCVIHNCYRLKWGHYEVVNSISGSNVKVQNSLGSSCSQGCYCGYVEDRSTSEFKSYINGISQKSVLVITRG